MSGIDRDGVRKSQLQVVREFKQGDTHHHYHGAYISNNTISGSKFSVAGDTVAPALSSKLFWQRSVKRKSDYNTNPSTSNNNIQKEKYYYKSPRSHANTSEASEASEGTEASEYDQNLVNEYILLQNELSKTRNRLDKAEIEGKEPLIETYSRYLCELQVKENIITQLAIRRHEQAWTRQ